MSESTKWIVGVCVAFGLAAAIVVGGWQLHWWLKEEGTQRTYEINRTSQQYQAGLIARERDYAADIDRLPETTPQRAALVRTFCTAYLELAPPPPDLQAAYKSYDCEEINP